MRKLLHGGRVAQQGDKRTEHHQRTGGAHALGALGIIRAQNDEGGKSGAGKQFVIGTGERQAFGGQNEFLSFTGV